MIQRIQTVYLSIVAVLMAVMSFSSLVKFSLEDKVYEMKSYGTLLIEEEKTEILNNLGIGILGGIIFLLSLVIIVLFKNRKLQIKLSKGMLFLCAAQTVALFLYVDAATERIGEKVVVDYNFPVFFPLLCIILTFLAIKAIVKDDELVRSVDRLR